MQVVAYLPRLAEGPLAEKFERAVRDAVVLFNLFLGSDFGKPEEVLRVRFALRKGRGLRFKDAEQAAYVEPKENLVVVFDEFVREHEWWTVAVTCLHDILEIVAFREGIWVSISHEYIRVWVEKCLAGMIAWAAQGDVPDLSKRKEALVRRRRKRLGPWEVWFDGG